MLLVLRVVGWPEGSDRAPIEAHFDEDGGMIGRSDTARLSLPDPKRTVSRFHAHISSRDGVFYIEDMGSTNPASLNGALLGANQRAALNIGDQVKVGDYTLAVEFGNPARVQAAITKNPFENWGTEDIAHTRFLDPEAGNDVFSEEQEAHLRASTLPFSPSAFGREIGQGLPSEEMSLPSIVSTQPTSVRDAPSTIPMKKDAPSTIPSAHTTPLAVASVRRDMPPTIALAASDGAPPGDRGTGAQAPVDVLWRAFQEGLRINHLDAPNSLKPELMRGLGQMLRSAVVGLRRLWAVSGQTKADAEELAAQRGRASNPLKLAPDDIRALAALLRQSSAGHLTGAAAVDELVQALEKKQAASAIELRLAVEQVLLRLAPQAIEHQLKGQGMISGALPMWRKAKLWDLYVAQHAAITYVLKEPASQPGRQAASAQTSSEESAHFEPQRHSVSQ